MIIFNQFVFYSVALKWPQSNSLPHAGGVFYKPALFLNYKIAAINRIIPGRIMKSSFLYTISELRFNADCKSAASNLF